MRLKSAIFVNINRLNLGEKVHSCDVASLLARVLHKTIHLKLLFVQPHETIFLMKVNRESRIDWSTRTYIVGHAYLTLWSVSPLPKLAKHCCMWALQRIKIVQNFCLSAVDRISTNMLWYYSSLHDWDSHRKFPQSINFVSQKKNILGLRYSSTYEQNNSSSIQSRHWAAN